MPKAKKPTVSSRMIHIRLSQEDHKRLRITAAEQDTSIQSWVEGLILSALSSRTKGERRR